MDLKADEKPHKSFAHSESKTGSHKAKKKKTSK